jgi:hypothetical protein
MTKFRAIKPMTFPDLVLAVVDVNEIEWVAPIARALLDPATVA